MTTDVQTNGFPPGYFFIRSVASNNRLLDIVLDKVEDGTEVILWPEKETSLVEGSWNFNHCTLHSFYIYINNYLLYMWQLAEFLKPITRLVLLLLSRATVCR